MSQQLPDQIKKQSKAVQDLYQDMGAGDKPDGDALPKGDEKPDGDKPAASSDAKTPAEGGEQKPAAKSKEEKDDKSVDFEQKYLTLQGMFNKQVPDLKNKVADYEQRIQSMEALIAGMGATDGPAAAAPAVVTSDLITEEHVKEYGESLDMMRLITQVEMAPVLVQLGEIKTMLDGLNEVVPKVNSMVSEKQATTVDNFWAAVEAAVPDWKAINANDDFVTWLLETDPASGTARQDLLDDAQSKADSGRVIHLFKAWIGEAGYVKAGSGTDTAQDDINSELEQQLTPGKGKGAEHKGEGEKPSFTRAEISAFYGDVAKGKFKGKDSDRARIEAEIFDAQSNGRVS